MVNIETCLLWVMKFLCFLYLFLYIIWLIIARKSYKENNYKCKVISDKIYGISRIIQVVLAVELLFFAVFRMIL